MEQNLLFVAGAAGGLAKSIIESKGRVIMPNVEDVVDPKTQNKTRYIHLGFVANMMLGGIVGYFLTSDPVGAVTAGLTTSFVMESIIEKMPYSKLDLFKE